MQTILSFVLNASQNTFENMHVEFYGVVHEKYDLLYYIGHVGLSESEILKINCKTVIET